MTTRYDIQGGVEARAAEEAVATLGRRIEAVRAARAAEGEAVLAPPLSDSRDHVEGPVYAPASLVVFGSYGTPATRRLDTVLRQLRDAHPGSLRVAWRHLPDSREHPLALALALAAEAAAAEGRFSSMHRELLAVRHGDLDDLHDAARRAGVDFYGMLDAMRAGVGAHRVVADVESAAASGVASAPTVFVDGERYSGDLNAAAVWAAHRSA